jgi:hypothetical protein
MMRYKEDSCSPEVCLLPPSDLDFHRVSVEVRGESCIEVRSGRPK